MDTMATVAIITRTKDRAVFLKRAIASIAAQTFQDYEHVIINDGGDSAVIERVLSTVSEPIRSKITVFHRPQSSNAPDTIFNESIDRVDSKYVAIHDDDDTWHPEFLAQTIDLLRNGAKGVVVRADKVIEKSVSGKINQVKTEQYMADLRAVSLYRQCVDNQLTPIAFIYERAAYQAVGKYDSNLPVVGDWEFGIRFLQKYDVEYLDPGYALAYYHHRVTKDNSFAAHNHRRYITKVLNQYLRRDLEDGKTGVGYIMNDLRYEQDMITATVRKLVPTPIAKIIRKKVRD